MPTMTVHQAFSIERNGETRTWTLGQYQVDEATAKAVRESDNGKAMIAAGKVTVTDEARIEARTEAPKSPPEVKSSKVKAKGDK